jgi:TfuA protein
MNLRDPIVVFLGPSCDKKIASKILDANYLPPARRGDILKSVVNGTKTIVLIDGSMIYEYPPSVMEVYQAISEGVTVVGCASLGALRGVELRYHGMFAMGWVYQKYLERSIVRDDELVTPFDPITHKPLTIPLVRIRYSVSQLTNANMLNPKQGYELIDKLLNVYCEDRTDDRVRELAKECNISSEITESLLSQKFDVKANDTIECLSHLRMLI